VARCPMTRFVALLGAINVGGHRITMDRLRVEVASLGYTEVAASIASGMIAATDRRPFGPTREGYTHMVAFCRTSPGHAISEQSTAADRFELHGRELHWLIDGRLTDSKVTLPKLAKLIGPNTTRNITSLERLALLLR